MSDDHTTEERIAIAQVDPQTEPDLLAAIEGGDQSARLVYGDWLEERGDHERAEYVRLQDRLVAAAGREREDAIRRIRWLDGRLDLAWRMLVARPVIAACSDRRCPGDWGGLIRAERSDVRSCTQCAARVPYHPAWPRLAGEPYGRERSLGGPAAIDGYYDLEDLITGEWPPIRRP